MKRFLLGISVLSAAAILGGCPIYPSQQEYQVCSASACYSCPDPSLSAACTPWPCQSDNDCTSGYVCDSQTASCVAGNGTAGVDGGSSGPTDCSVTGCPSGEICRLANGVAACVPLGGPGEDAPSGPETGGDSSVETDAMAGGDTSTDGSGISGDSSPSADAANDGASTIDASDAGTVAGPCNDDTTCGGQGAKCVDGQCTAQIRLCSDGSQCAATGSACVDGLCEPHCSASNPCPTGSQCDLTRSVCNVNPGACSGSGTSSCQGGTTCVEGHCVPPCAASDAGPTCPAGQVCINAGCIPDQRALFACANDGQSGQLATTCADDAICIHHDCYTGCGTDGSSACASGSICKSVTIETGTYAVCGTTTTLGSDCDPSQGKYCSGSKVCVDGYCQ